MNSMKWTGAKPNRDGWFWLREPNRADAVVQVSGGRVRFIGSNARLAFDEIEAGAQWAGPISEPMDAEIGVAKVADAEN